jgi:DNA polymerase II large subunit
LSDSELPLPEHSPHIALYFKGLSDEVERVYKVAEEARGMGFDPTTRVEIPPAHDVAARVEATLEGPLGVAKRIRELQQTMSREEVAFAIAKEIATGDLGTFDDDEKAADKAVRVALSILTESITAAPLEGIARVRIRGSGDDKYLAIYLAGPIRAAGGTEAAMTVLVADYVRQVLGLPAFVAREVEIERAIEEVELYARQVHLQYPVHPEFLRLAASRLPIMLTGEPTEDFEVSGSRDLDRIETNRVRSGFVLVLNDGVVGRAAKLGKIVERMKIPGWEWLSELEKGAQDEEADDSEIQLRKKLGPKSDYLADVIGGRPVFSHPSKIGGFRLRYGRSRNTGLAAVGVHPATMYIVEEFLAPGTHIRTERPGKGSIVTPVDTIEGPTVLLKDGSVLTISTVEQARTTAERVKRILYLGDVLVALGEFLENNHPLISAGYCEEWWSHELDESLTGKNIDQHSETLGISREDLSSFIENPLSNIPTPKQAITLSKKLHIPLHPAYLYRWPALSGDEIIDFRDWFIKSHEIVQKEGKKQLVLPNERKYKDYMERMGIPHILFDRRKMIQLTDDSITVLSQFGDKRKKPKGTSPLEVINSVSQVSIEDRLGTSIGARMGRPEKAEERRMRPPVQALFPVGRTMASERRIEKVAENTQQTSTLSSFVEESFTGPQLVGPGSINLEMVARTCPSCGFQTFESRCPDCGTHTEIQPWCSQEDCGQPVDRETGMCPRSHDVNLVKSTRSYSVDIAAHLDRVKNEIKEPQAYGIRGVLGLTSDFKISEYLGKGILRAKHQVYCYRDGTARFDATDAPLTHITPLEIGVEVNRLIELGYENDYLGIPLTSDDQILELKVQDIVVPENCADYLVRVGRFIDDCLEKIYGLEPYYNFRGQDDVIGQLVIGLAPHTSAGIIGRIIGFTNASMCYAHPFWHAAKRRNCDGDEDAVILVLDALINFSKSYLPAGRGGLMDAPLVLSVILNPSEVDDESHNIEVCTRYPADFYKMVEHNESPKVIEGLVDIVATRLGTAAQYEGLGFTHGTSSIDNGPHNTKYKMLGSMAEKLEAQLHLATIVDAVDAKDVAERVLSHHFFRDIRGNLRAYSTQKIQCLKCHRVYRRIPMSGECVCGGKLSLTVRQKNISKYLGVAEKIIEEHNLGEYLQERLRLIKFSLDSLFFSEQTSLTDFF